MTDEREVQVVREAVEQASSVTIFAQGIGAEKTARYTVAARHAYRARDAEVERLTQERDEAQALERTIQCPKCHNHDFRGDSFGCADCGYEPLEYEALVREQLTKAEADIAGYQKRAATAERDRDREKARADRLARALAGLRQIQSDEIRCGIIDAALKEATDGE